MIGTEKVKSFESTYIKYSQLDNILKYMYLRELITYTFYSSIEEGC